MNSKFISFQIESELLSDTSHQLSVCLQTSLHDKIIISVVYIQPDSDKLIYDKYFQSLQTISDKYSDAKIMSFGDFNLPNIRWSETVPLNYDLLKYVDPNLSSAIDILCSVCNFMGLSQVYPVHSLKGYTLDLLLTNIYNIHVSTPTEEILSTDQHHEAKIFTVNLDNKINFINDTRKNKNFFIANYSIINHQLFLINWDELFVNKDLETNLNDFYSIINNLIDIHVSLVIRKTTSFPNWYTKELIKLTRIKKNLVK